MPAFRATVLVVCELVAALQATATANVLKKRCEIDLIGKNGPCPHDKATEGEHTENQQHKKIPGNLCCRFGDDQDGNSGGGGNRVSDADRNEERLETTLGHGCCLPKGLELSCGRATPTRRNNRHYTGLTELAAHERAPAAGADWLARRNLLQPDSCER